MTCKAPSSRLDRLYKKILFVIIIIIIIISYYYCYFSFLVFLFYIYKEKQRNIYIACKFIVLTCLEILFVRIVYINNRYL